MVTEPADPPANRRTALSKELVLREAVALADEAGSGVPSMRRLAQRLGVEAMSLYHHFRNKDLILDGMVDLVFDEIELPADGNDWCTAMRDRAASMRAALIRHQWAIGLMDSRTNPGPATLRHHDAVLGCLRASGFSVAGAAHALSLLDSYVYGFTLQELSLPFTSSAEVTQVAGAILEQLPRDELPHLAEMIVHRALAPGYSYAAEFDVGLDLILDGLQRSRENWR
ncbi:MULTISPECIES: TetR/AcrR family transcriptional regulator [unclassified Solwaraspora]|uniref:TetR/AcrR family transcriptional regulator n=1 Tax=unclassified Solwaraspora TaxID=2627926 RepID=UPI00248B9B5B|nr:MULTISPECIES: TetR/AcrR family transcriptional regulator [unclassified Solwaraspora]WBB95319.1 TetR/AcrR family transcriptional regulator [Solwaraspora sp. WMMA2059]WBC20776.1 TetR/AcrR family transcriptional regulator [Solwaraspora sp. WMMA2080]WJK37091.1 TetR/AcrR family transcriptional regulator [Solwaraspora sp. WMMA2065]